MRLPGSSDRVSQWSLARIAVFVPMVVARALQDNDEKGEVHVIDPLLIDDFWTQPANVAE